MDEDTKEIIAEMQAEGIETESITGGEVIPPKEDDDETVITDDSEEEEEETEDEESEEESEDEDDDSEEEEEEDAEEDGKPKKLTIVQKYRKERKLRKELETTLQTLQNANSEETFDKELKAFAEKAGMNLEVAKGFLELAAKRAGLPKDLMEDLQKSRSERRDRDYWSGQHKQFDKDFNANVKPTLESLGKTAEEIKVVYETLNGDDKSPFWAWDKKNKSTSLVKLALSTLRKGPSSRTSSEGGNKNLNRGKSAKAVEDMTGEDIDDMSDEDFDTFSDSLGKQSKSVVSRK